MAVFLENKHPKIKIDNFDIERKVKVLMGNLNCLDQEINILLMGDADIRQLNKEFRNNDYPTDVLSFPQNSDEDPYIPDEIILGDIAISLDKAKIQAKEHGLSFKEEIKMRNKTRELFKDIFPETILENSCNF